MGKSTRQFDDEGLPIPTGNHADTSVLDKEGLPVPKKKDTGSASPLASSPNQGPTEPPVNISGSAPKQVTANYKDNSITPKDLGDQPLGQFTGPSLDQISGAINNKGKNIDKWSNAPSDNYISALVNQHQEVQGKIANMDNREGYRSAIISGDAANYESNLKNLKDRETYLRTEIQKNYDAKKSKLVSELVSTLKENFPGANWVDVYSNEKKESDGATDIISVDRPLVWDKETNKLTPKSVKWIQDQIDPIMNKKKDAAVNAAVSGDLDNKPRTYADLTKAIVDQLNLVPVQKAQQDFTEDYIKKNPNMKDALLANKEIHDYFSKNNFDDVKAKVKVQADKEFINTQERYYGKDGLFQKNQDYVGIQHKYAQLVADKKMSQEVAMKQMEAEIKENPALKKIKGNFDTEKRKIIENTQKQYENYVIEGLKGKHPEYTTYKDGSIGLSSLSEDQYTNMVEGYQEGLDKVAQKMLGDQAAASMAQSNRKAKSYGPLLGSLVSETNELAAGLTKMIFNKTGWGGAAVRNFQADEMAGPNINQSDVAATWNLKGWESLLNPSFYLSGLGKMVPVIAGGAVVSATTEGEGIPEYVNWLANAGLFTAQTSLSTYNQLLNTKDENGNLLTESDAAHYTANQAEQDFLPNVLMMAVGSGTLLRAKNIVKPTILGAVKKGVTDLALQQPFFAWQGYNDYATMQEATGKKTDIYDYLQSKDFRDNLLNGVIMGGAFSLLHAPGSYKKSMDNWEKMVHTSEGEFKNLIPQNYALGQEMAGNGDYLRDALKMHIFNIDPENLNEQSKRQLSDLKNQLLYSVNFDRNIKTGNLDPKNIKDLYQAHNLALADQHDYLSDRAAKEGNKSLSDIYKDKEKDYREQAKASANGEAKYHYLVNDEGHPIFMSDKSFKTLEQEGTIAKWMKDGTIESIHSSDDSEFAQRYKDFVAAKDESKVEGKDLSSYLSDLIEENKDKLGTFYGVAKENPESFYKAVSDQVHGVNSDGTPSGQPNAEQAVRDQYGDDIVDVAKIMYPTTEELKPEVEKPLERPEEKKASVTEPEEYKPQIRDDYFAKADFFTPEEKEKFETLDDAGKDKMIDDKRAELKGESGISVIKPGDVKKPDIVPLVKTETISSPIKNETDGKETKESEGRQGDVLSPEEGAGQPNLMKDDTPTPPIPPPPVAGPSEEGLHPRDNEWASIQKKDLSEQVQKENAFTRTNKESIDNVVNRLSRDASANGRTWQSQAEFEVSALHNEFFNEDGSIREAFNPTTDQLALIGIRLMDINRESSISEFNPNDDQQTARTAYLENEKMKAERLLSFGEAGRAFQFRQSLLKMGIDGDIQIKRKAISAAMGVKIPETDEQFNELSDFYKEKIKPAYEAFKKWKTEYEKENKTRNSVDEKYSKEEFDKRIKEAVANALKEAKVPEKTAKITKDSSKKISDSLKNFADKFEKFGRADLPDGTQTAGFAPDIQKKIADAIRYIAEKIANGDIKIPELISEVLERFSANAEERKDLEENIRKGLSEAGVDEKSMNAKTNREKILGKMKEISKNSGVKAITKDMVDKGLVRDYLHDIARRGTTKPEDILEKGVVELKKEFPDTDEKVLRDAYLKEGNFTPNNSKDLEDQIKKAGQTFRDVTILQRDIEALEVGSKLYGSDKDQRNTIISEYEAGLKKQKDQIIKDRDDAVRKNKEEYRKLETERNRQLKVVNDLKEKIKSLQSGIRPDSKVREYKEDTPEIEALKKQKDQSDKDLREIESAIKTAQKKAEKIAEYDRRIADLDNHKKVWDKAKKGKQVDKDLAAKREELRKAIIKNGIKLETGSKDARQTKEKVIQAHNERVNNLKNKITDLLNDDTVPEEDKKSLLAVKSELDKMGVKIDAGQLDDKIKKAISASEKLRTNNITNLLTGRRSEIFSDLKDLAVQLKKDNNSGLQDIQLNQLKKNEVSRKEKAERDLAAGNFDDTPKLSDFKKDEELLKLTRDRKMAESNLAHEIDRYQKQNQSFWQRQVTRLQRLQRANLISGIMTNGKVLVATVVKPVSDALVRRTVGTLTSPILKSLGLKGDREVLNNDATIKSFVDSFKGMTQREAAQKRGIAETGLENATTSLQAANDQLKALETQYGKDKPEYQQFKENEYTKAVNDFQSAQYDWAASMMYDFISPRAWAERLNILKSGASKFEESMGGRKGQTWADEKSEHAIGTIANKIIHTLEIFGRIHGAEKDISARQAFVEGFLKRTTERIKAGEQLTPSKLEGIALESYPNFLGGKFQNKNPVSDFIRKTQMELEEKGTGGKVAAFVLGAATPVLKVPLNIEAEGLLKYTAGLPIAIGKTFYEIGKALKTNNITIKEGIKDFNGTMEAIREHMKQLSPEKRDMILQYANKGIFGAAMALVTGSMAASGNLVFGGAYEQGKKKRKYLDEGTGQLEELGYGQIALNGHKLGKFWSAVVMHLPPLMPAVMSATYVQKYKDERGDYKDEADKTTAAFDGLAEVVRTAYEESALKNLGDFGNLGTNLFNSFTTQMAAKNISEFFDTEDGTLVERKGENFWDNILLRTGGRKFVPTKEQYMIDKGDKIDENSRKVDDVREDDPFYEKSQK